MYNYTNGTRWTFTWGNGRRLENASNGTNTISYNYTADGIRTSKTVNGVVHTYYYSNGLLRRETYGNTTLDFFYDANGTPAALKHNNTLYYYITNLQGDVIRLVDANGNTVALYKYDPYGNPIHASGSLATINPLRYRGYYYDAETGLYYCQSRYYDPVVGRFLNADEYTSTGQGIIGNNMFAYCGNNPIAREDADGEAFETAFDLASLAVSAIEYAANPTDLWALAALSGDLVDVLLPFVTGVGETVKFTAKVVKAADAIDDATDAARTVKQAKTIAKVHGNSLSTTKPAVGYILKSTETGEIMKYGETTRGIKRYTKKYYTDNKVTMEIIANGTKREMHQWQHKQIIKHTIKHGKKPPLNRSFW